MDSWFITVLMCGLVIIESLNGAHGNVIPEKNNNLLNAMQAVQQHYKLTGSDWVGRAVFTPYLGKMETCSCESLMLAAMLNSYRNIFSAMLKESKSTESQDTQDMNTERSLKELQANVTHLWEKQYQKEDKVLRQLHEIKLKDVKNGMIQGGAVNDFLSVFNMAIKVGQNNIK